MAGCLGEQKTDPVTDTQGDEAEIGKMRLRASCCQRWPMPPGAGRGQEGPSPGAFRGSWPRQTLLLDFWPPGL